MPESPMHFQIMYAVLVLGTLLVFAVTRNQVKSLLIGAALAVTFMLSAGALHSMTADDPATAGVVIPAPTPVPSPSMSSPAQPK